LRRQAWQFGIDDATLPRMSFDPAAPAAADAGIFGLDASPDTARIVLIPVPFDATTSYKAGASGGPQAILSASSQVDLFDIDTGRPYEAGIAMLPIPQQVIALNIEARAHVDSHRQGDLREAALARVNSIGTQLNAWVYGQTRKIMQQGRIVGLVGGDHATPFGCIRAHAEAYADMGILQVDAHADLRHAYEGFAWSHASIMYNVLQHTSVKKIVQVGVRDFAESEYKRIADSDGRITTFFDRDLADRHFDGVPFSRTAKEIVAELPQQVYVSFDIDGLDPGLCPNTGTPVPGGLQFQQACALLAELTRSGRQIIGFDLNEVAPGPAGDEWDGNVGARILYKLCGHALLGGEGPATQARSANVPAA
jgi:agmatinase